VGAGNDVEVTYEVTDTDGAPISGAEINSRQALAQRGRHRIRGPADLQPSLPKSIFKAIYDGNEVERTQDISVDPVVRFGRIRVTVELRDSQDNLLDTARSAFIPRRAGRISAVRRAARRPAICSPVSIVFA
jgi:hypothetical protein